MSTVYGNMQIFSYLRERKLWKLVYLACMADWQAPTSLESVVQGWWSISSSQQAQLLVSPAFCAQAEALPLHLLGIKQEQSESENPNEVCSNDSETFYTTLETFRFDNLASHALITLKNSCLCSELQREDFIRLTLVAWLRVTFGAILDSAGTSGFLLFQVQMLPGNSNRLLLAPPSAFITPSLTPRLLEFDYWTILNIRVLFAQHDRTSINSLYSLYSSQIRDVLSSFVFGLETELTHLFKSFLICSRVLDGLFTCNFDATLLMTSVTSAKAFRESLPGIMPIWFYENPYLSSVRTSPCRKCTVSNLQKCFSRRLLFYPADAGSERGMQVCTWIGLEARTSCKVFQAHKSASARLATHKIRLQNPPHAIFPLQTSRRDPFLLVVDQQQLKFAQLEVAWPL